MSKQIVIRIDVATGAKSVTDEAGNPAQTAKLPFDGNKLGTITDYESIGVMATHNSPGCRWVWINGDAYWVCD